MIHTEETEPIGTPMGAVTFVGFGPGDPGLITYAGSREVAGADLLVVDSPAMVEELASVGIEPLGEVVLVEADEVAQLVAAVTDGRSVVRLVEGDFFTEAGHVDVLRRLLEGKRIRTHHLERGPDLRCRRPHLGDGFLRHLRRTTRQGRMAQTRHRGDPRHRRDDRPGGRRGP